MSGLMPDFPNAACREPGAEVHFYGRAGGGIASALRYCNRCWDRPECLAWGLEHETSGVWGGHSGSGLRAMRKDFGISVHVITGSIYSFREGAS